MTEGRTDADLYANVAARLLESYRMRVEGRTGTDHNAENFRRAEAVDRRLRLAGLKAERDEYFRLARSSKIPDDLLRKLVDEVDLAEARYDV